MRPASLQRIALIGMLSMSACMGECGLQTGGIAINGELGNGEFSYSCVGLSDPACDAGGLPLAFPTCIVVGGRFRLDYALRDRSARSGSHLGAVLHVEPGSTSYFTGTTEFEAVRVGRSVFLAREGEQVLDLLHLNIAEATTIEFRSLAGTQISTLEVTTGDVELVRVLPGVQWCATPGGALSLSVSGGDPLIATATAEPALEIVGVGPGTTTFVVRLGELERELSVTVTGDAPRRKPPAGGEDTADTGETGETESSTEGTDTGDGTMGESTDGLTEGET